MINGNSKSIVESLPGGNEQALSYYQRALVILEKIYGKQHPHVVIILDNIKLAYRDLGFPEKIFLVAKKLWLSLSSYYRDSLQLLRFS